MFSDTVWNYDTKQSLLVDLNISDCIQEYERNDCIKSCKFVSPY